MIIFPMKLLCLLVCLTLLAQVRPQSAQDDLVDNFIPNLISNWYSGYFNLTSDKDIHYVFFESQKDRNDPLIVYLGGGPGCSSMHAMVYENGPFTINSKDKLSFDYNIYGWNQHANVLYIETPAGVGFSTGGPSSSDQNVTKDNVEVIIYFLTRFPTYLKNDLYIAGSGYAGITAPYLVLAIIQHNENPIFHSKINVKGLLLGNPCTTFDQCFASGIEKSSYYHYEFLYNHGFLSDNHWNDFKSACALDYNSGICYKQRQTLDTFFNKLNASSYNIYDKCYTPSQNSTVSMLGGINEKCEDTAGLLRFMNDETIQDALHVNRGKFNVCNEDVFEHYIGDSRGSYWTYPKLIEKKQRIFIFSGDFDSTVPTLGTKTWVRRLREELDIPVKKVWREWWVQDANQKYDQVGGMVWELNTLTLATVRGAGLMAGRDKPKEIYTILDAFLNNKRLPVRT